MGKVLLAHSPSLAAKFTMELAGVRCILDNDGRVMMSPCAPNPSVTELIRLVAELSTHHVALYDLESGGFRFPPPGLCHECEGQERARGRDGD
ncbi:hypothetical protein AAFF_G00277120 [Aldrovandia affinis]|uniref:Uncharacterized protein n=1 Tax=Aldrovandia affinis TaxID=143900 RepID=A0AAD7W2G3_9TELE|nr:hypothetical protein AAFF_G00277120 [Aldrovandia affinis]